jgi:hypothetical protein
MPEFPTAVSKTLSKNSLFNKYNWKKTAIFFVIIILCGCKHLYIQASEANTFFRPSFLRQWGYESGTASLFHRFIFRAKGNINATVAQARRLR